MKITKRILVTPFVFGILLMTHLFFVLKRTRLFLMYGGEFKHYESETSYDYLQQQVKSLDNDVEFLKKVRSSQANMIKKLRDEMYLAEKQKKDSECEGK